MTSAPPLAERRPQLAQGAVPPPDLDDSGLRLWALTDGSRTLEDLVLVSRTWPAPPSIEQLSGTLAGWATAGLLQGDWGVGTSGPRLVCRLDGRFGAGVPAGLVRGAGTLAFAVAAVPALLAALASALARGVELMPAGASPWTLMAALFVGVNAPQLARAAAVLAAGRTLASVGLEVGGLFPRIGFAAELPLADRRRQAAWGLGAHAALAGLCAAAALATGDPVADQALAVMLLLMVLDASPVLAGDGQVWLAAWTGEPHLKDRVLAFLRRRFLRHLFLGESGGGGERRLMVVGLATIVWAALALRVATALAHASADGWALAVSGHDSLASRAAGLALLLGLVGGMVVSLLLVVAEPVRWAAAAGFRGEPMARVIALGSLALAAAVWQLPPGAAALVGLAVGSAVVWLLVRQVRNIPGAILAAGFAGAALAVGAELVPLLAAAARSMGVDHVTFFEASIIHGAASLVGVGLLVFGARAIREAPAGTPRPLFTIVAGLLVGLVNETRTEHPAGLLPVLGAAAALFGAAAMAAARAATPMRHFWRPFLVASGLWLWSIASRHGAHADAVPGQLAAIFVLLAAALAASVAMFAVPMPLRRRPEGHRAGASDAVALADAGAHLVASLLDTTRFFLGEARATRVGQELPVLPAADAPPPALDVLKDVYTRALAVFERELTASAGRRFHERALAVAAEGLYWLEWESAHAHLLAARERAGTGAELTEELSRLPLFRALPPAQLAELVHVVRRERHEDGAVLVKQGEAGDRFFVVCRGNLDVVHEDALGHGSVIAHLHADDAFGELALLGDGVRTATVVARGPVELVSLSREDFDRWVPDRAHATALIRHGAFLRRLPLLATLPSRVISTLAAAVQPLALEDGARVVEAGRPVAQLYMIKEGHLVAGDAVLGPGDTAGAEALAGPAAHAAALVARGSAAVVSLEVDAMRSAVRAWLVGFDSLAALAGRRTASGWEGQ